jgi:autotransporter-associated beta strand protein
MTATRLVTPCPADVASSILRRVNGYVHASAVVIALALPFGASHETEAQVLWSNAGASAWLTGGNWTGGASPTTSQVAQFGANPTATTGVGINMNGSTNNGTRNQAVGAIEQTSARTNANLVGNSSTTVGGTLTLNGAPVNSVANVILRNNSSGGLTLQNTQATGNQTMTVALGNSTINQIIVDSSGNVVLSSNVSGASRVLGISGAGTGRVDFTSSSNTFGGQTTGTAIAITGAEVRFTADGSLGTAPGSVNASYISIDGGRFATANAVSFTLNANRGIHVGDTVGTSISTPGAGVLTYNGVIADAAGKTGSWAKQGGGTLALGGVSTYTGSTTIASGTIQLTTGNDRLPTGTVLSFGQAASTNRGTLDLGGFNQTVAGLATIVGSSGTTNIVTTSVGSGTLSINVTSGSSFTYGDGSTTNSGVISGAVSIVKLGAGTQILGGSNSYTGPTTVSAGTLRVNGVLGSGSLSVAASAWLMGTGTINGPVTVNGTLSPGSSPGVITLGSLTLTDTSTTVIEVASAGTRGTAYDGVSILTASGLTYGGTMTLAFGGSAIANNTTFDIFAFTGSSSGSLAAIESSGFYAGTWTPLGSGTYRLLAGDQTLTFSQSTGDVIVVPEPAAMALAAVGLGTMGLALLRRRRQA